MSLKQQQEPSTELVKQHYKAAMSNIKEALPAIASPLDRLACHTTAKEGLKGKVVVITGGGSGFGRAFTIAASGYGAKVFVSDISVKRVEETAKLAAAKGGEPVTVFPQKCDTSSWEDQVAMFRYARKTYGHIDIVIPNAGVGEVGELLMDHMDASGEPSKPSLATIQVNLVGAIYTTKLGMYHLRENPAKSGKAVVFVGSLASLSGLPLGPCYGTAKHGILGLFRSAFYNGRAEGIAMNCICPWFTETGILEPAMRMGLFGLPLAEIDDVIAAMLRSASDPNFTGNTVVIDAEGILAIPFEQFAAGKSGYFSVFESRAARTISAIRFILDTSRLIKQVITLYWARGIGGGVLVALIAYIVGKSRR
ncbi:NAD(P)-binding protein [Meredithblackwellia eburnea MCA 4105]